VTERFLALGLDAVGSTPAEFAQFIRTDLEKWTKLVRELNLTLQ
jgi:tripartite-type tricarboxylate transporter receptor subunit TctC